MSCERVASDSYGDLVGIYRFFLVHGILKGLPRKFGVRPGVLRPKLGWNRGNLDGSGLTHDGVFVFFFLELY